MDTYGVVSGQVYNQECRVKQFFNKAITNQSIPWWKETEMDMKCSSKNFIHADSIILTCLISIMKIILA